ncbi:MAG: bifunctional oligoribonuclease/PAP phosphatase NrnA [Gemmatimonadota bacterium]
MPYRTPPERLPAIEQVIHSLESASRVVLTTHVNADGDGAGSEVAVLAWLRARGAECWIVNPTRFPDTFSFLLPEPDAAVDPGSARATEITASASRLVVLDTGEIPRIGRVKALTDHVPKTVVDHHLPGESPIPGVALRDESACATGELVYDLLLADGAEITREIAEALYVAIMTDTGSFRFSNASPSAHRIAGELIERGVHPEVVYERVYGSSSMDRFRLLAASLVELEFDEDAGVAWMTVPNEAYEAFGSSAEDLDGFVDYPRSVRGAEVGLLFRSTTSGDTKISFRSRGRVNVNALARQFGGGGHAKASGALVRGSIDEVRGAVLDAARRAVRRMRGERGGIDLSRS